MKGVTTPQRVETEEELRTPPKATPYLKITQRNKITPYPDLSPFAFIHSVSQNIMWADMIQKRNRFSGFLNDKTSVPHNGIGHATKIHP